MFKRFWPLLLWLIYLISPIDLFPDTIFGPGFIDDAFLLWVLYWLLWRKPPPQGAYRRSGSYSGGPSYERTGNREQGSRSSGGSQTSSNRRDQPKDPYTILDVDRGASFEQIRKAYHRQANRYHPDKVSHLGEEFQQLAKQKFQDIQWAYETLAKQKGKPV